MTKAKRTKLFIILAVCIIALLLIISVAQIVSINNKERELNRQQTEIDRLTNELNYYENQSNANSNVEEDLESYDDKNGDILITENEAVGDNQ